jgi:hypothetical protein
VVPLKKSSSSSRVCIKEIRISAVAVGVFLRLPQLLLHEAEIASTYLGAIEKNCGRAFVLDGFEA